jgi:hypothetical protein
MGSTNAAHGTTGSICSSSLNLDKSAKTEAPSIALICLNKCTQEIYKLMCDSELRKNKKYGSMRISTSEFHFQKSLKTRPTRVAFLWHLSNLGSVKKILLRRGLLLNNGTDVERHTRWHVAMRPGKRHAWNTQKRSGGHDRQVKR